METNIAEMIDEAIEDAIKQLQITPKGTPEYNQMVTNIAKFKIWTGWIHRGLSLLDGAGTILLVAISEFITFWKQAPWRTETKKPPRDRPIPGR